MRHRYLATVIVLCTLSAVAAQGSAGWSDPYPQPPAADQRPATDASGIVRNLIQDRQGNIWAATFGGMLRYDGEEFVNVTASVTPARFFDALEDRDGNFWFASVGHGVFYYDGVNFRQYTTAEGLVDDRVTSVYEDRSGNVWFGTERGLSCFDGQSFTTLGIGEGVLRNNISSITEDEHGVYWFATRGGIYRYDGAAITPFTQEDGTPFGNVRSLIRDTSGNTWIGEQNGLWRYDGQTFTRFSDRFTGHVYADRSGNIWTSSGGADRRWVLTRYAAASLTSGTPDTTVLPPVGFMLFGILEAADGDIWFGADAVYRYDGKAVVCFTCGPAKT